MSSYDVRIWDIFEYVGKRGTTHRVRWTVAGTKFGDSFKTKALAESFRSKLITASREGSPFDEVTGLPMEMARDLKARSWYEHACAFVDLKWPRASGRHRQGIAEGLAAVTPALLATTRGAPSDDLIRAALRSWAFNKTARHAGTPPAEYATTIRWLEANTVKLTALDDPAIVRKALDTLSLLPGGKAAASSTYARKRAAFSGALSYAVELRLLAGHPLASVKISIEKTSDEIDRRIVVNPHQAKALLAAVADKVPELEAFFGSMYYSALRPEEVLHVKDEECELPPESEPDAWGWWHLTGATVKVGAAWNDGGGSHEDRGLKHRKKNATRDAPIPPQLVALLRKHRKTYKPGRDGRLFVGRRGPGGKYFANLAGATITNNGYATCWRAARKAALTPAQVESRLAKRPYDLRHAAVSLWLNAGVPPTQVAEWAGHSVHVLMKVYAKCVYGQDEAAKRRIAAALADAVTPTEDS